MRAGLVKARYRNKRHKHNVGKISMSKIARESVLLLSLFAIAAMVQFFAQSLPMALCFYFLPTLYSAYFFGRRWLGGAAAFYGAFLLGLAPGLVTMGRLLLLDSLLALWTVLALFAIGRRITK